MALSEVKVVGIVVVKSRFRSLTLDKLDAFFAKEAYGPSTQSEEDGLRQNMESFGTVT